MGCGVGAWEGWLLAGWDDWRGMFVLQVGFLPGAWGRSFILVDRVVSFGGRVRFQGSSRALSGAQCVADALWGIHFLLKVYHGSSWCLYKVAFATSFLGCVFFFFFLFFFFFGGGGVGVFCGVGGRGGLGGGWAG